MERSSLWHFLKQYSLFSFVAKNDVTAFIIHIIIRVVVGAVAGIVFGLLGLIPIIGIITGVIGGLVGLYFLASLVFCILDYVKII